MDANGFISKVERLSQQLRVPNGKDIKNEVGFALWSEVKSLPLEQEQEALVTKWAKNVVSAVRGFSDFKDCFWETEHFFELAITNMPLPTVIECIKACDVMWATHDVSESFAPGWANAVLTRCKQWLTVTDPVQLTDPVRVEDILGASKALTAVANAGSEYEDLISSNTELLDVVQITLQMVQEASSHGGRLKKVVNNLLSIKAMCLTSGEDILKTLELAVNMRRPRGGCLLKAYNAMCDQKPEDLTLQLHASRGPLAALTVHVLRTMNEGTGLDSDGMPLSKKKKSKKKKGGKGKGGLSGEGVDTQDQDDDDTGDHYDNEDVFLEACVFLKFLLQPWQRKDPVHMEAKRQIAISLLEQGALEGLLSQFTFWATEWGGNFGDPGDPCMVSLLEFYRYFPDVVKDVVFARKEVLQIIRQQAVNGRNYNQRHNGSLNRLAFEEDYERGIQAAVKLENLLEGKTESGEAVDAPAAGPCVLRHLSLLPPVA